MLELEELLPHALGLEQGIRSGEVITDAPVLHVAHLHDGAAEEALGEHLIEGGAGRIVVPVEGLVLGEQEAYLGEIEPEQGSMAAQLAVLTTHLAHGGQADDLDVQHTALLVKDPFLYQQEAPDGGRL